MTDHNLPVTPEEVEAALISCRRDDMELAKALVLANRRIAKYESWVDKLTKEILTLDKLRAPV